MYAEGHRYAVPIAGADVHVRNWSIYRQYIEVFNAYIWCAIVCPRVVLLRLRELIVCVCVCRSLKGPMRR
jgi:hypothetical protein